jgi:hypothetical protein
MMARSIQKARRVKQLLLEQMRSVDIATHLGISVHIVNNIRCGGAWKHVEIEE